MKFGKLKKNAVWEILFLKNDMQNLVEKLFPDLF